MKKPRGKRGKKPAPPRTREEGAIRIGRYMRWLYGSETPPDVFAAPLIDATFDEIDAIADKATRERFLTDVMDRAYRGLGDN